MRTTTTSRGQPRRGALPCWRLSGPPAVPQAAFIALFGPPPPSAQSSAKDLPLTSIGSIFFCAAQQKGQNGTKICS